MRRFLVVANRTGKDHTIGRATVEKKKTSDAPRGPFPSSSSHSASSSSFIRVFPPPTSGRRFKLKAHEILVTVIAKDVSGAYAGA